MPATIITAPDEVFTLNSYKSKKVFLAGGITNCPNWQESLIEKIDHLSNLTIYNPRREIFLLEHGEQQIVWEYEHLKKSDLIVFWFSKGSLNPISLYELGRWSNSSYEKEVIIGIDPEYERSYDVIIQTQLSRNDIPMVKSIDDIAQLIIERIEPNENKKFMFN